MRLLVTGGASFIGNNFSRHMLDTHQDWDIRVLDKITYAGHPKNLQDMRSTRRFEFVQGDIADRSDVRKAMKDIDAVVNFAAETHVDRSLVDAKPFWRTNAYGTHVLTTEALRANVRRYHQISTDEVFGELPYKRPDVKFLETSPYNPRNPYAQSKAAADEEVMEAMRYGLPATISYFGNNYGPRQTPDKFIPRSIALLLNGDTIKLRVDAYGTPGGNIRNWTHVDDSTHGIEKILLDGKVGERYSIGGDNQMSNAEVVQLILQLMPQHAEEFKGKTLPFDEYVQIVEGRTGDDLRYDADISKIKSLGWKPEYGGKEGFMRGLQETVQWYVSSEGREWLEAIGKDLTAEIREGQDRIVTEQTPSRYERY